MSWLQLHLAFFIHFSVLEIDLRTIITVVWTVIYVLQKSSVIHEGNTKQVSIGDFIPDKTYWRQKDFI